MYRITSVVVGILVLCGLVLLAGCGSGAGVATPSSDAAPGTSSAPAAPRTLVVTKTPSATEFNSIEVALREAHNGDTISIKPGSYDIPFALVKPVTIVGDGKREEIVLTSATLNPIVSTAPNATLSHLTVKFTGKNFSAISVRNGSLLVKDCDISAPNSGNGVQCAVAGSVELDHCTVHHCGNTAVYIGGKGNIHDCVFSDNDEWGVGGGLSGTVICKKNIMSKNRYGCVIVEEMTADLEDNDLGGDVNTSSKSAATDCISVSKLGKAKIVHNKLHDDTYGVIIMNGGEATLENNEIHHNNSGVYCEGKVQATLTGDKVYTNRATAIHFQENATFKVFQCDVYDNGSDGTDGAFSIALEASGTIGKCKVHNNHTNGITAHHHGNCQIEDNDIYDNDVPGVLVDNEGEATLRRNRIHNHKNGCGMIICNGSVATMENNELFENALAGVRLRDGARGTLRGNKLNRNETYGVEVSSGSSGTFDETDVRENALGGWSIQPECKANVHRTHSVDDVTPLSRAKAGDWLEKKVVVRGAGNVVIETVILQIVKSVTPEELTLDTTQTVNGVAKHSVDTVPVTAKTDFVSSYVRKFPEASVDVKDKGSATIDVLGKPLKTTWTRYLITRDMDGKSITLDATVWASPEIPLDEIAQVKCNATGAEQVTIDGSVIGYGDASKPYTPPVKSVPQPLAPESPKKPQNPPEKPTPPSTTKTEPPEKPAAKKPITIFKLKDGSTIRAVLAIESGDQVQIKDDAGKFHAVNKDDILKKTTE